MITSFEQLNRYLEDFAPGSIKDGGVYTLERMEKLMPLLGNPQETIKIIHVAGTSGKTSTSYYVASLLQAAGAKTGLSVSPHVFEVNERVQVDGQPLPEKQFCKLFDQFISLPGILELKPTYFEILVAFAYWSFVELGCTHAVVEVGLGGLLDGTNVVENQSKVAVITDLGLDHTHILGSTIEEITRQKAGIIKSHNHVFMLEQDEAVKEEVLDSCAQNHAILHYASEQDLAVEEQFVKELPLYQKRNWLLAKQVSDFVIVRDGLKELGAQKLLQAQKILIPARMQHLKIDGKTVILDGAHNPQKLEAFTSSFHQLYPTVQPAILVGFSLSKTEMIKQNLQILKNIGGNIIATEFQVNEDFTHKAVSVAEISKAAKEVGFSGVKVEPDAAKALQTLLAEDTDTVVITGSFYLIGSLKSELGV